MSPARNFDDRMVVVEQASNDHQDEEHGGRQREEVAIRLWILAPILILRVCCGRLHHGRRACRKDLRFDLGFSRFENLGGEWREGRNRSQ
jgi:hypothetical protein